MNRTPVLFLLSFLLIACTSVSPTTLPTATSSPTGSATPSQTSAHILTPSPSAKLTQTRAPTRKATATPLPTSAFTLERVAQIGGSINGIMVVGDVAYVGMGPRLAAIDISQHQKPRLVSQSEPLPGLVTLVLQISSESAPLLLVNAGKYLVVIDTTTPGELKPVNQLELPGAILAMVWDDRARVIFAEGSTYQGSWTFAGFVSAVGIDQDNRLKLINTVALPERPWSLALGKGNLFAGLEGYKGGLYYIPAMANGELSTPRLVIPSTPEKPLIPTSMQVIGERLYLGYRFFDAYDITNPDQPMQAWVENFLGGPVIDSFSVSGEEVYVFGWTILSEYIVDSFTVPEPIEGEPIGVTASVTAIHDGDFVVAYNDLKIYDTADPQNLQLVGSFLTPVNNAIGAVANEKAVFVIDNGAGDGLSNAVLRVLSLPDLKPLGQVMIELPTDSHDFHGIALDGDRVYIALKDSVWAYDVSSEQPTLLWKQKISEEEIGKITALQLAEKRLLIVSRETKGSSLLTTYDLTDLQKPVEMGEPFTLERGDILQMTWDGSALNAILRPLYENKYVILYRFDFDNHALAMRESLQVPGYLLSMAIDQKAIALAGSDTLAIVSGDETGPRRLLALATLPEYGLGVATIKDMALVVVGREYGAAQLLVYDLLNPSRPRRVEAMDIAVSNLHELPILVTSPYVVLANGAGGVEVLEYSTP